jgi:uncharacterized protein YjbI with pentapeptide repeats
VTEQQLRNLFCRQFNCPPSDYEERAFRELLFRHARLVAPVVRKLRPNLFAEDFKFIRYLGEAPDFREAKAHAADFQDANLARKSFWRTTLKIRVSGGKAIKLAQQLF